jgi:hypothetical protein
MRHNATKKLLIMLVAATLTGCAGLDVTWDLRATYMSKEYLAKQQEQQRLEDIRRLDP